MKPISRREAIQRGGRFLIGAAACSLAPGMLGGCSNPEVDATIAASLMRSLQAVDLASIRMTIIYDNVPHRQDLQKDWGFSCLIEGLAATVLFDAGRFDNFLMANMAKMRIDPGQIGALFLSHDHPDHVGGSLKIAEASSNLHVFTVKSFPNGFKRAITKTGATLTDMDHSHRVNRHCLSTGEMRSVVKNEHALVVLTDKGAIIVTGCAHPGVVEITERVQAMTGREILLLLGGYHLLMDDAASIRKKALRLDALGVKYVAPSHCSGGEARAIFADLYGDRFIDSGVGRIISADDLV